MFEILESLSVKNANITIDAIATRINIVRKIIEKGAQYVLSLKSNQKNMYEAAKLHFTSDVIKQECECIETVDKGHGRIEQRKYWVCDDLRCFNGLPEFYGIKTVIKVERTRIVNGIKSVSESYFISSIEKNATKISKLIRGHWAIENSLHWVLDVTFSEDKCRARTKNAAENMSLLRKISMNILRANKKQGMSFVGMRIAGGLCEKQITNYLVNF